MTRVVSADAGLLREGLLDVLRDAVESFAEALAPCVQAPPRVHAARRHYTQVLAIGDLLDAVDWTVNDAPRPYEVDIERHAWAATAALERVIARQYFAAWSQVEQGEVEGVGEASSVRQRAEEDLARIQLACRRANIAIVKPEPRKTQAN
jgi:hypothetical protein